MSHHIGTCAAGSLCWDKREELVTTLQTSTQSTSSDHASKALHTNTQVTLQKLFIKTGEAHFQDRPRNPQSLAHLLGLDWSNPPQNQPSSGAGRDEHSHSLITRCRTREGLTETQSWKGRNTFVDIIRITDQEQSKDNSHTLRRKDLNSYTQLWVVRRRLVSEYNSMFDYSN